MGEGRSPNKSNKVLEASNLRAFYKLYIIGNQWYKSPLLGLFVRPCTLVYCLLFGSAVP